MIFKYVYFITVIFRFVLIVRGWGVLLEPDILGTQRRLFAVNFFLRKNLV